MQASDDLYLGTALGPNPLFGLDGNPAPMSQGVGPMGRIYLWDVVPAVAATNNLALAQAVAGAANLTLTAGASVTRITLANGLFAYVLDCPRTLQVTSASASDTTQTVTFTGFDAYNQPMTARVTLNGTAVVTTLKAFKSITSIAVSAVTVGNISAGTFTTLGLPVRVTDPVYIASAKWNSTLADNGGTFTAAVTTDPATALTGDVRGLYLPTPAPDGTRRLVMGILIPSIGSGPQATRIGAFGVQQA